MRNHKAISEAVSEMSNAIMAYEKGAISKLEFRETVKQIYEDFRRKFENPRDADSYWKEVRQLY